MTSTPPPPTPGQSEAPPRVLPLPFVRTLLGDLDPKTLGVCYAHEHLIISPSYTTDKTPDFLLDDVEAIASELAATHRSVHGGIWCIDSMPAGGAGRDVLKLAEVSRRSGVPVVAPTGLHLAKYYPQGHWGSRLPEQDLADLFTQEITQAIDANDLAGPTYTPAAFLPTTPPQALPGPAQQKTHGWPSVGPPSTTPPSAEAPPLPLRAGLIKVAGGRDKLSPQELRLFRAAAAAHRRTGCPILTHTEEGTAGLEQAHVLIDHGVPADHIVLSHLDRLPDPDYHRAVLRLGVRLEYDSHFRWKSDNNPTLDLLLSLLPEFPDQFLLGMDAARRSYWTCFGGRPGMSYLVSTFIPRLRAAGGGGLSEDLIHKLTVTNGRAAYSFAVDPP